MLASIELQIISRLLVEDDENVVDTLCEFDSSYYSVFKEHIEYILQHRQQYGNIPDLFTFQARFPDVTIVKVSEPLSYLTREIKKNKQRILLVETFNKLKDLGSGDVTDAWNYLAFQCDKASRLDSTRPVDLVKDAKARSEEILEFSKQSRIPTGFVEIDKLMYGGLSTVEELLLIIARTNTGKSWFCTKLMESAQRNHFPVLYYSPEMQASYLGTRFDTWRAHFQNSSLYKGDYSEQYLDYLDKLSREDTSALVLEDKHTSDGSVNIVNLETLVKKHRIKLLIIDGLSYMSDVKKSDTEYMKYKNICLDLFRLSKQHQCAVVVALQANRETRDNKDDKGEAMPSIYNIEGSDHPARICTQAFALRQVFDKHVLDIRLEKSRMANNQKPMLSYAWDPNTGNAQYIPGDDDDSDLDVTSASVSIPSLVDSDSLGDVPWDDENFDDGDVEF